MSVRDTPIGGAAMTGVSWVGDRTEAWPRSWRIRAAIVLALLLAIVIARRASSADWDAEVGIFLHWLAALLGALSWPTLAFLVLVSGLHYVAAAVASRAAAGVRVPMGELATVQLAAAAANRLTPAGLGGAAIVGRYFVRRGRLEPAQATAALSALALVGGTSDVLAFALLVGAGTMLGLSGASGEVPLLIGRIAALAPSPSHPWVWIGLSIVVIGAATTFGLRRASRHRFQRGVAAVATYAGTVRELLRRPLRVLALFSASASTTLLLAAGFAAAAMSVAGGSLSQGFVALMIGYMVAAAAGGAVPTPGGFGAADAALVGVLLAAGVPTASAVGVVLAFRAITFWAPAVIGMFAAVMLRRRNAL